jgi:hypothetical protein
MTKKYMDTNRNYRNNNDNEYNYINCINNTYDNIFLTYIPKFAYIYPNQILSKNISPNIFLRGSPTSTTPVITSSNGQIATTKFVHDVVNNITNNTIQIINEEMKKNNDGINNHIDMIQQDNHNNTTKIDGIINNVGSIQESINIVNEEIKKSPQFNNPTSFVHVSENKYHIEKHGIHIIETESNIHLPFDLNEGIINIVVINKSGGFIDVISDKIMDLEYDVLIYNNFFSPLGDTKISLSNNTSALFSHIKNKTTNKHSWIVSIF